MHLKRRWIDYVFLLLLIIGSLLIIRSTVYAQGYCTGFASCGAGNLLCGGAGHEGDCATNNYDCGGGCSDCHSSWGDPCTCYFYNGHCSIPWLIDNGVPQYHSCVYQCCDTVFWCF